MVCRYCKQELPDNAVFCGYCGKRLAEESAPPIPSVKPTVSDDPPGKPKNKTRIAAIAIVIALLALILFFVLPGFFDGKNASDDNVGNNTSSYTESSENTEQTGAQEETQVPETKIIQSTVIKTKADGSFVSKTVLEYDDLEREIAGTTYDENDKVKKSWKTKYDSEVFPGYSTIFFDSEGKYSRTENLTRDNQNDYHINNYIFDGDNYIFLYDGYCTVEDYLIIDKTLFKYNDPEDANSAPDFDSYILYNYDNNKLIKERKYGTDGDEIVIDVIANYASKKDPPDSFLTSWIDYEYDDNGYKIKATEYDKNGNVKYNYEYENDIKISDD